MGKRTSTKLTDNEVQDIARDLLQNRIFTSWQIAPQDVRLLGSIFMPLALLERKDMLKLQRDKAEMFYANMSGAGPRSINGYPMFFEVSYVNQEDAKRVWNEYQRMKEGLDGQEPSQD